MSAGDNTLGPDGTYQPFTRKQREREGGEMSAAVYTYRTAEDGAGLYSGVVEAEHLQKFVLAHAYDQLQSAYNLRDDEVIGLIGMNAELAAERDALKADAARYRWYRLHARFANYMGRSELTLPLANPTAAVTGEHGEGVDSAIDSAMATPTPPRSET